MVLEDACCRRCHGYKLIEGNVPLNGLLQAQWPSLDAQQGSALQVSSVGPGPSKRLTQHKLGGWALISEYTSNLKERLEVERRVVQLLNATSQRVQHGQTIKRVTYGPGVAEKDWSEALD